MTDAEIIARWLADHRADRDGCLCGWASDPIGGNVLQHEQHVAEVLVANGVYVAVFG